MPSSIKLGRIGGIQIGIHYTWVFAFLLITWSLAVGFFPGTYPGWDLSTYWITGMVAALALFGSVLIHELSHSFMAIARGQEVDSITLFIFGGVSNLKAEAEDARDEFLIAVVGPLTSFVLAAIFWAANQALAPGNTPFGAVLGYLALINVILGVFNLLPGFPLDGGRVLRSIIWGVTGSLRKATQFASYVGQGIGFLLIFWGVSQLFAGAFLNGLWIAFIGWFLNNAAEATRQQQTVRENLSGIRVAQLMEPEPAVVDPDLSVYDFVFEHVLRGGHRAMLLGREGRLLGIVSITDAKEIPQEAWPTTPVGQIMTPAPLKVVAPETDMNRALELLVEGTLNQLPVVQDGRLVGLISRADVLRYLQLRDELDLQPPARERRDAPTQSGVERSAA